jgi:hypothetical protein
VHDAVLRWLPSSAGTAISTTVGTNAHMFAPWGQLAVTGFYTVVVLIVGAVLFRTRDA